MKIRASAAAAALLVCHVASASIIEHGTYFTDTASGLDWLNNQPLAGQTYNAVLSGFGGYTSSGWRFATGAELVALVTANVGTVQPLTSSNGWTSYNFDAGVYGAAYHLIELLGINVSFGAPPDPRSTRQVYNTDLTGIATQGWFDDGDGDGDSLVGVFDFAAYIQPSFSAAPYAMTQVIPEFLSADDFRGTAVSSILVRSSSSDVSEPPSLWLAFAGLLAAPLLRASKGRLPSDRNSATV